MHETESFPHVAAQLMIMLSVILIAAKIGGEVATRYLKIPAVLGELGAGIIISPHLLGGIDFFGVVGPVFHLVGTEAEVHHDDVSFPLPTSIRFVGQIAAILLLFEAGLETNRAAFMRALRPASAVAVGGVVVPFALGVLVTVWLGFGSFGSLAEINQPLFVGTILTATSIGITARVLAELRQLDSAEGLTVIAAAVIDDVLGIIMLAIVVGLHAESELSLSSVGTIFLRAAGFWLGLMIVGSLLARYIAIFAIWFKDDGGTFAIVVALGMFCAGIAETNFGLAMIIGAYTIGLALSGTRLKEQIETPLRHAGMLLVPTFFAIIGMEVDLGKMFGSDNLAITLIFVVVLTVAAFIGKVFGAGLPALAVGFDRVGATRIGLGMLPRGEVALIVAGIGFNNNVIDDEIFGVAIIMTIITTVIAPILLPWSFRQRSTKSPDLMQQSSVAVEHPET